MSFVVGQRVRVRDYDQPMPNWEQKMGNPHCIIGHFGRVKHVSSFIDIEISHGPNGGPIDRRIIKANTDDGTDIWPMDPAHLEAVD